MTMTLVLVTVGVGLGLWQTPAPAKPCSAPEYRQFDFWAGEWEVRRPDGQLAGHNRIEIVEGGCGLQENWTSAGANVNTGRSLNAYVPGDGKWHQIWLGSDGLLMHLSGTFSGDTLTLTGTSPARDGQTQHHRLAFTRRADGSVRQFWEMSGDGKTWKTAFEGIYTRVGGRGNPPAGFCVNVSC